MRTVKLDKGSKNNILTDLLKRSANDYGKYEETVREILSEIKEKGDEALFAYTKKFDGFDLNESNIEVTRDEIDEAYSLIDSEYIEVMKESAENVRKYHEKQLRNTWLDMKEDGTILGQRFTPVDRAGIYVPGGKAAYPSSVIMNIIPAKVAGVSEIIMTTPPGKDGKVNPGTLVAADIAGADRIFKAGGAQAIGAMAYGTKSVPKVDKITGPGNIFVALAKKAVYGIVGIDSLAGPSEIVVLADETANPSYVAADLLSQAEHDEMASAILVTTSKDLAEKVSKEVDGFLPKLKRRAIIEASLNNFGYILLADSMEEAVDTVNAIAGEHLEILTKDPFATLTGIKHAGAIFLGEYSSEPLGDYYAGPDHIIPTNGTAKFFSPLGVDDFIKRSSIICYSRPALERAHKKIELFAENEGLDAHANSIKVRFE